MIKLSLLLHIFLIINMTVCYACSRARKKLGQLQLLTDEQQIELITLRRSYTVIESRQTCNLTLEPKKSLLHCYHGGKCFFKKIFLNSTHIENDVYCVCQSVNTNFFYNSFAKCTA